VPNVASVFSILNLNVYLTLWFIGCKLVHVINLVAENLLSDSNYFNAHSKRILVRTYILMRIVTCIKQSLRPNDVTFNSQYQLTFNL